jgi:hypothetical protein
MIIKETYEKTPDENSAKSASSTRTRWVSIEVPIFTQDRNFLSDRIPSNF